MALIRAWFDNRQQQELTFEPNGSVTNSRSFRDRVFKFSPIADDLYIKPGSVIVVPTNYDYKPTLEKYRSVTSVVFESFASLAAFLAIKNN